ncbi:hypothetical protein IE81DRAFT_326687 [Ceraceosorus guamensis]|uniref:Uncharacterized protein n=1 Tax=Ceraceosorus guamensis TaxID=1522189 RepID=A0A316VUV3_9BASI|nr:hypothetical protein IE81DRAFT_326687 [Ceraceosorus guamensis]PWN39285.1 hypothetical protein IE81DRAFT_326687 [Ceraceosorus guamensis]
MMTQTPSRGNSGGAAAAADQNANEGDAVAAATAAAPAAPAEGAASERMRGHDSPSLEVTETATATATMTGTREARTSPADAQAEQTTETRNGNGNGNGNAQTSKKIVAEGEGGQQRQQQQQQHADATDQPATTASASAPASRLPTSEADAERLLRIPRRSIRMPNGNAAAAAAATQKQQQQTNKDDVGGAAAAVVAAWGSPDILSGIVLPDASSPLRGSWIPQGMTCAGREFWYLLVMQGVGAALISGAINFGIAVACYKHQVGTRIWPFEPLTVAGDMGVTVIIQQVVSMLITSALVHADVNGGPVAPLSQPWPPLLHLPSSPTPSPSIWGTGTGTGASSAGTGNGKSLEMGKATGKSKATCCFWWAIRSICTGSERDNWTQRGLSLSARTQRVLWCAAHGLFLCALLTFWWYWPIAIAIVAPIYQHKDLGIGGSGNGWTPCFIKLLFGALLAMLTNPFMALLAMGAEYNVRRAYPDNPLFLAQPWGEENLKRWKKELGLGL